MALLSVNPRFAQTLQRTAGARIAREVTQRLSSTGIKRLQQIMQAADFVGGVLGDYGGFDSAVQPLLGGVTMREARETFALLSDARLTRKNLFFIELTDPNPPELGYVERPAQATPESSRVGEIVNVARRVAGVGLGGGISAALGGVFGGGGVEALERPSVSQMFNLFATAASYTPITMVGEKIAFGSAMMDRLTGTEAVELQITTMDDEVGTIKRWFEGKAKQAAHADGTFGVPGEYLIDISIFHAIPKPDDRAYRFHAKMRPTTIQHDLGRSEQTMQELQMNFSQFDTFFQL